MNRLRRFLSHLYCEDPPPARFRLETFLGPCNLEEGPAAVRAAHVASPQGSLRVSTATHCTAGLSDSGVRRPAKHTSGSETISQEDVRARNVQSPELHNLEF